MLAARRTPHVLSSTPYFQSIEDNTHGNRLRAEHVRSSDINLPSYRKCVIYLDTEIANRAFNFGMPQEQLDGSEVASSAINERRFGSAQRMRSEKTGIQSDSRDPLRH